MRFSTLALSVLLAVGGCHAARTPELRVLGVQNAAEQHVFVQVRNPASRPMRLTSLSYTFASSGGRTVSEGELPLFQREIPAGAVAVLEVPLDAESSEPLQLKGTLVAELDQYVRTFTVAAQIQPH